jgi:uncharacterized membrane protein
MAGRSSQQPQGSGSLLDELPVDRLKEEAITLGKALAKRGAAKLGERLTGAPGKLGDLTDAVPGPKDVAKAVGKAASPIGSVKGAASKVKDALPGTGSDDETEGGSDGSSGNAVGDDTDLKVTNIVEAIDVPVSREVAYELWTQFEEFPSFMKKVEAVNQKDPAVVSWKAQIFWSHRTWTAKIVDQVPPERIVWKSEADKGKVDGAVTFHELAPDLTRVLVSLEYFPQGLFERTGNLWRAQGRRVRLELKHFRRYVANHALINQDDVDGWTGEIHDGKVKRRRGSSATAKKSSSSGSTASKSSSNGSTTKKSASSGSTAKRSASSGSTAKKSASSGSTAKKSASSGSTAKKSTSSGSTAKKSTSSQPAAKKSSTSRPAAKRSASGSTSRKRPAKKASGGTSKRTAAAAKRSSTTSRSTSRSTRSKS